MQINWYPGHMTKAIRMIDENLRLIDAIIYVLDARAPLSCLNPDFDKRISHLPVVYVLNKTDLASDEQTQRWKNYLSQGENRAAITMVGTATGSGNRVISAVLRLCSNKIDKLKSKGVRATVRAMILGVPNTGKSTLTNNLCGKAKAITGNKAGVTRGKQWVRVSDVLEVLDTPGTLYPKLADQKVAAHLAYIGSIKEEILDTAELAYAFLQDAIEQFPEALTARYNITLDGSKEEIFTAIARKRGFLLRGGIADLERTADAVLDDFRKGRMGKITLDRMENDEKDVQND